MLKIDQLRKEAKEQNKVPTYNGLGMIRLLGYMFYSDLAKPINHTIHNHRYSFTSTVIKGTIRNFVYEHEVVEQSDFMLTQKDMVQKQDNVGTIIHPDVKITNTYYFDTSEGEQYYMQQEVTHHVERITSKLITHMDVSPRPWSDTARFLIDKRIPYVGVYSQPKSPEECWEIIEYTIRD